MRVSLDGGVPGSSGFFQGRLPAQTTYESQRHRWPQRRGRRTLRDGNATGRGLGPVRRSCRAEWAKGRCARKRACSERGCVSNDAMPRLDDAGSRCRVQRRRSSSFQALACSTTWSSSGTCTRVARCRGRPARAEQTARQLLPPQFAHQHENRLVESVTYGICYRRHDGTGVDCVKNHDIVSPTHGPK